MDVRDLSRSPLLPYANPLLERIQECGRDDYQVPDSFQSHTSSRHHRGAGGDYHWSRGIGRSVVVVHYVRDRSFYCGNKLRLEQVLTPNGYFFILFVTFRTILIPTSTSVMRAWKDLVYLRLFPCRLECLQL